MDPIVEESPGDVEATRLVPPAAETDTAPEPAFRITFEDDDDEGQFVLMLRMCHGCMAVYLVTTAVTICSSNYTAHPGANIDAVLLASDILTIDVTSCFFVMSGFVATYVYSSVGGNAWRRIRARLVAQVFGNMWLSTTLVLFFGSIDKLVKNRFYLHDVLLTLFEGVSGVRLLDTRQGVIFPHSFNVSLWPVQAFVWCLLSVHGTYHTNDFIRRRFGELANYVICVIAGCGITLFTFFGMLHSDTNVFYANATSVMYRTLEFNLGIHFFYLAEKEASFVMSCTRMLAQCSPITYLVFLATWWSEVGEVVERRPGQTCLRLYPRNSCLRDHHVFLLRGCVLGLTMLSTVAPTSPFKPGKPGPGAVDAAVRSVNISATAVALSWPVYVIIQLIFKISFSDALVFENSALISFMMPVFLYGTSMLYTVSLQELATDQVEDFAAVIAKRARVLHETVCGSVLASQDEPGNAA